MKRIIAVIYLVIMGCSLHPTQAQGFVYGVVTTTDRATLSTGTNDGQWEFIRMETSPITAFLVNKFTGEIKYLKMTSGSGAKYRNVTREESPMDVQRENSINYQLYSGSGGKRDFYLLNINTGVLWRSEPGNGKSLNFKLLPMVEDDTID